MIRMERNPLPFDEVHGQGQSVALCKAAGGSRELNSYLTYLGFLQLINWCMFNGCRWSL